MESLYRKSQTLFRTVPSLTPTASPSPRLGVHNPTPKLQSLLSQERLKLRTANLADTFIRSIRTQAHEKFGDKGAWAYPGMAQIFLSTPIISGTGKATNFKLGRYIHRVHANKRPLKICENRKRGRIQGFPKFLKYPYYLRNRSSYELQIFYAHSQYRSEQKPITNFVAGCIMRTLETFQGTHVLGASRGLLCDSSAVLFVNNNILSISLRY